MPLGTFNTVFRVPRLPSASTQGGGLSDGVRLNSSSRSDAFLSPTLSISTICCLYVLVVRRVVGSLAVRQTQRTPDPRTPKHGVFAASSGCGECGGTSTRHGCRLDRCRPVVGRRAKPKLHTSDNVTLGKHVSTLCGLTQRLRHVLT